MVQAGTGFQFQFQVAFAALSLCAAVGVAACASTTVPEGTLEDLRAFRDAAARAERVDEAVAISQAIVDREGARAGAATFSPEALARAWVELARAQVAAYDRASARASYERAIDVIDAADAPPADPIDSRAYTQLALLDRTRPAALAQASKAVGILERRYDAKHFDIIAARLGVADVLWATGSIVDGHAELVGALADARALVGENHEATAEVYSRLAQASDSLQRAEEAERLYKAALAVLVRMEDGGASIDVEKRAELHRALSGFYKRARRNDEARAQSALESEVSRWTNKQRQVRTVSPTYPPHAKQKRVTGWVEIVFTISESGRTEDLHVVESTPDGIFDRAAEWAVEHWRYAPGQRDGVPAAQRGVRVRLQFTDEN